ncbi:hypothetical protein GQ42DRAFT_57841 [Ramicandelaber brevisporus]|nr:hypothetical protein GQ42DRAFT_57841 [Ramicandelaber brevisporus]
MDEDLPSWLEDSTVVACMTGKTNASDILSRAGIRIQFDGNDCEEEEEEEEDDSEEEEEDGYDDDDNEENSYDDDAETDNEDEDEDEWMDVTDDEEMDDEEMDEDDEEYDDEMDDEDYQQYKTLDMIQVDPYSFSIGIESSTLPLHMLPVELIEEIMLHCNHNTLSHLCLVSKAMHNLAIRYLYRRVLVSEERFVEMDKYFTLLYRVVGTKDTTQIDTLRDFLKCYSKRLSYVAEYTEWLAIELSEIALAQFSDLMKTVANSKRLHHLHVLGPTILDYLPSQISTVDGLASRAQSVTHLQMVLAPDGELLNMANGINTFTNLHALSLKLIFNPFDITEECGTNLAQFIDALTVRPASVALYLSGDPHPNALDSIRRFVNGRLSVLDYMMNSHDSVYIKFCTRLLEDAADLSNKATAAADAAALVNFRLGSGVGAYQIQDTVRIDPAAFMYKLGPPVQVLSSPAFAVALDSLRQRLEVVEFYRNSEDGNVVESTNAEMCAEACRVLFRSKWSRLNYLDLDTASPRSDEDIIGFMHNVAPQLGTFKCFLHTRLVSHLAALLAAFTHAVDIRFWSSNVGMQVFIDSIHEGLQSAKANDLPYLSKLRVLQLCKLQGDADMSPDEEFFRASIRKMLPHVRWAIATDEDEVNKRDEMFVAQ